MRSASQKPSTQICPFELVEARPQVITIAGELNLLALSEAHKSRSSGHKSILERENGTVKGI